MLDLAQIVSDEMDREWTGLTVERAELEGGSALAAASQPFADDLSHEFAGAHLSLACGGIELSFPLGGNCDRDTGRMGVAA